MTGNPRCSVERLETRALLAHIGLDLGFGDVGHAPQVAGVLAADQPGGKILTMRFNDDLNPVTTIVRLNSDGSVDPSFNDPGPPEGAGQGGTAAVVSGSRVILTMPAGFDEPARYSLLVRAVKASDGSADAAFGVNGVATLLLQPAKPNTTLSGWQTTGLIATPDGGAIIAMLQYLRSPSGGGETEADVMYKLNAAGQLDPTFGNNGVQYISVTSEYAAYASLKSLPDGRFMMLTNSAGPGTPTLSRHLASGALDATFAGGGELDLRGIYPESVQFPSWDNFEIQPDGKILNTVNANHDDNTVSHLMRLNSDGTLDTSFATGGGFRIGGDEYLYALRSDSANRAVGFTSLGRLFRLTADGAYDPTFDDDGSTFLRQTIDGVATHIYSFDVTIDASDRILFGEFDQANKIQRVSRFGARERVVLGPDGVVNVEGDESADTLSAERAGDNVVVNLNSRFFTFPVGDVSGFRVDGGSGDNRINLAVDVRCVINTWFGKDSIATGNGGDWIVTGDESDTVDAGGGKDILFGGYGADSLAGGAGDDKITGESESDSLDGGPGNDRLFGDASATNLFPELNYFSGLDSLSGGAGNDTLYGGPEDDRLAGDAGRDRLHGDDGFDRLYGGASGDWLFGGSNGDRLYGQGGADQLLGEGGNDRLYGDDAGADTLRGGAGDDRLITSGDNAIDYLFGDAGRDTALADQDDLFARVEVRL